MVLVLAAEFEPEIIFLETALRAPDGAELVRHLRALPIGPRLFIIAVTEAGPHFPAEANRELFDYHFPKPLPRTALDEVLIHPRFNVGP